MRSNGNGEAELVDAEVVDSTALARAEDFDTPAVQQVRGIAAQMQLQWEKERQELLRYKQDDLRQKSRMQIAAMVAGNMIGEGAMGSRMRSDQIAEQAVELADAVLVALEKRPIPLMPKKPPAQ